MAEATKEEKDEKKAEPTEEKETEKEKKILVVDDAVVKENCTVFRPSWTPIWNTDGMTQIKVALSFWRASGVPAGWMPLCDLAVYGHLKYDKVPNRTVLLVKTDSKLCPKPKDYVSVWDDHKTNGLKSSLAKPVSIWRPVPPSDEYVALGNLATPDFKKPSVDLTRCIPRSWVREVEKDRGDWELIWTDAGSRCVRDATIFVTRSGGFWTYDKAIKTGAPEPKTIYILTAFDSYQIGQG